MAEVRPLHALGDALHYIDRAEALEAAGLREYAMSQENVEVVRSVHEITAGLSELDGFTSSS